MVQTACVKCGGAHEGWACPMKIRASDLLQRGVIWPAQCSCGHLYLEQYQFNELTKEGNIGFVWCGFCQTKRMVRPCKDA